MDSRSAGTACSCSPPSGSRTQVRESRRADQVGGARPAVAARAGCGAGARADAERRHARAARRARVVAARRRAARSTGCSSSPRSTSCTCTSRSLPARRRPRCVTRARSTWAASTLRPSACSRRRWRGGSSSCSSGVSTPGSPPSTSRARLISRFFPGDYDGRAAGRRPGALHAGRRGDGRPAEIAFVAEEERASLRLFLRALRRLPLDRDWRATIWSPRARRPAAAARPARCASACGLSGRGASRSRRCSRAPTCCARRPRARAPRDAVLKAIAAGAVPVASRIPVYEEVLSDGDRGPAVRAAATPRCWPRSSRGSWRTASCATRCARAASRAAPSSAGTASLDAGRGHLPPRARAPPPPAGDRPRCARRLEQPRVHLLRPAHAHRPLAGLRDARRRAARDGQAPRPGRDRDHRPQRDLGRARGARARERHQGDRLRGGQDRARGRGDRALHRGEDPARHVAAGRRSTRSTRRAASRTCRIRSTACTPSPTTSTC